MCPNYAPGKLDSCPVHFVIESEAHCDRRASNMKLVDRLVREAVDAAAVTAQVTLNNIAALMQDSDSDNRFRAAGINVAENILQARKTKGKA